MVHLQVTSILFLSFDTKSWVLTADKIKESLISTDFFLLDSMV